MSTTIENLKNLGFDFRVTEYQKGCLTQEVFYNGIWFNLTNKDESLAILPILKSHLPNEDFNRFESEMWQYSSDKWEAEN